jgi:hypothetical protein
LSSLIAVVAAVASALMLGISSVADQRSTKRVESRRVLSLRILADLVRQSLWVTALGANLVGFALQVVALSFGSLALVQPILVCDLIFAVLILWYLPARSGIQRPGNMRQTRIVFAGVGASVIGVAGFLLNQDAFQQSKFLAPVQAIITSADPVISIALGIAWLNVQLRSSPADIAGEVVSILLMITGIVITANYAPLVAGPALDSAPPRASAGSHVTSVEVSRGRDAPRGTRP